MRESNILEFKETVSNTFLKTVSAFANYGTGKVIFGVKDDGTIAGLSDNLDQIRLSIENKINDSIKPAIRYTLSIDDDKKTITLTVYEGSNKPYFYQNKAYRRNDTSSIEVDTHELKNLILEGQNRTYDSLPSKVESLTFNYLEQAFQSKLGIEKLSTDILITLQLLNQDKSYSIAGELLSDQNHYLGMDMVRFGDSINIFLDRTILDGRSLLEQFDVAVDKYRQYYQYEEIIGSERISKELIPEAAFREAIANALIHRDWQIPAQIKVAMHKESIEISSPGGLVNGLSKEEYLTGQLSLLRNPILGAVFFRLHLIEKFGTGIQRIFASYEGSRIKPSVRILENSISITLPIYRESLKSLSPNQRAVYGALESKPLSSSQIVSVTGFGATKVRAILKELIDAGYVEKHGNGRGTMYACV